MSDSDGAGAPKSWLRRHVPVFDWAPSYRRQWLTRDLLAAATVWTVLVPTTLAYSEVAGVPVQYGLFAATISLVAYAVFGSSRRMIVVPGASLAVVTAAAVAPVAAGRGQNTYVLLCMVLAIITGLLCMLAGIARLGFMERFLAKPVLDGFVMGLAVYIVVTQIDKLAGVTADGGNAVLEVVDLFRKAGDWSLLTLGVGIALLLVLVVSHRFAPGLPAALIVLMAATVISFAFRLSGHGVAIVGAIPKGMAGFSVAGLRLRDIVQLLPGALAAIAVGFPESIAVAKAYASRHGEEIDANQELIALGAANIGAGLLRGFPLDGSLGKTAVNDQAGGRTQLVSVVCSALTALTFLFLAGLFKYLPQAALGAIVIYAVIYHVRIDQLVRYYRVKRSDFLLVIGSMLGVLVAGVLYGILIGVVLSVLAVIVRISRPHWAVLGRDESGTRYGDIERRRDCSPVPGALIFRFDAPLIFSNADVFFDTIVRLVESAHQPLKTVIVDMEMVHEMDTTATEMLSELYTFLSARQLNLVLARVHAPLRDYLRKDGSIQLIGEENVFLTVRDAVAAYQERQAGPS
ncbi:MAG: sulfate permease [Actinobacteria bacterium]|nr:sulfate permease [Actinomycetota bacterium]MBU2687146.1 sulfate permease [Actinomycetota bacterium]